MQENILLYASLYVYICIYVDQIWESGIARSRNIHILSFGSYCPLPCKYMSQFTLHPPTCESAPVTMYLLTHCDTVSFNLAHLRGKKTSVSL